MEDKRFGIIISIVLVLITSSVGFYRLGLYDGRKSSDLVPLSCLEDTSQKLKDITDIVLPLEGDSDYSSLSDGIYRVKEIADGTVIFSEEGSVCFL